MQTIINLNVVIILADDTTNKIYLNPKALRLVSFLWNVKNVVLLIIVSVSCQQFYACARAAATTFAIAMATQGSGLYQIKYKILAGLTERKQNLCFYQKKEIGTQRNK